MGTGGYGEVYLGKYAGLDVAIKKFGKKGMSQKTVRDFIKEVEIVNGLRHPHIVLYMGVSVD